MSEFWPSILLATNHTGLSVRRNMLATVSSDADTPLVASTMNRTASASSIAARDCSAIAASIPASPPVNPPVSITRNGCPDNSARPYFRSRVKPAKSATKASRLRVKRLNKVDFPTLGRPTSAMTGVFNAPLPPGSIARQEAESKRQSLLRQEPLCLCHHPHQADQSMHHSLDQEDATHPPNRPHQWHLQSPLGGLARDT